ncbi:hypothetical protein Tco_0082659, partial [Tanacetum coccineum]
MPWRPRLELCRGISIYYRGRGLEIRTDRRATFNMSTTEMPPKRTAITTTTPITNAAIEQLIAQGVADALVETKANRTSRNGDDS